MHHTLQCWIISSSLPGSFAGASPLELQTMPPLTLSMTTPHKRQRHSTFDVEKPLLGYSVTPEIKQNLGKQDEVTPSTEAMLKSISGDMGSEERRTKLMDAINKKVEISKFFLLLHSILKVLLELA